MSFRFSNLSLRELVKRFGDDIDLVIFESGGIPDKRYKTGYRIPTNVASARYALRLKLLNIAEQS